ncbi:MAG: LamG domain-containing protein, partial [Thermodesulfobacteriota bacterium]
GIDDFISIPESPNLEITDVITMDAWIKTPGVGFRLQGIVGKMVRDSPRPGYLTTVDQNGKFRCDIIRSLPLQGTAISLTTVTDNVFHHVACTYDGTSVSVYVDGNLESSIAYSDGIGLNDEPARIGYDLSTHLARIIHEHAT